MLPHLNSHSRFAVGWMKCAKKSKETVKVVLKRQAIFFFCFADEYFMNVSHRTIGWCFQPTNCQEETFCNLLSIFISCHNATQICGFRWPLCANKCSLPNKMMANVSCGFGFFQKAVCPTLLKVGNKKNVLYSTQILLCMQGVVSVLSALIMWAPSERSPHMRFSQATDCVEKTTKAADKFLLACCARYFPPLKYSSDTACFHSTSHFWPTKLCRLKLCPQNFELTQLSFSPHNCFVALKMAEQR